MDRFQNKISSTVEFGPGAPNVMKDLVTRITFFMTGALFPYLKPSVYQ